jgi:pimeloyl-ACP methyl ester carboxylesterase
MQEITVSREHPQNVYSLTLSAYLPNAQLIIYPDSGHGAWFQHAGAYTSHVSEFLERSDALVD